MICAYLIHTNILTKIFLFDLYRHCNNVDIEHFHLVDAVRCGMSHGRRSHPCGRACFHEEWSAIPDP